jgi:hypothetical protein
MTTCSRSSYSALEIPTRGVLSAAACGLRAVQGGHLYGHFSVLTSCPCRVLTCLTCSSFYGGRRKVDWPGPERISEPVADSTRLIPSFYARNIPVGDATTWVKMALLARKKRTVYDVHPFRAREHTLARPCSSCFSCQQPSKPTQRAATVTLTVVAQMALSVKRNAGEHFGC